MEVLLTGPVPGLSDELRDRILERAEGVPFYAVETVRMLLDRGAARPRGQRVPLGGRGRDARGAGDTPRADRRAARRARARRAAARSGRIRTRADVHAARARGGPGLVGGRARGCSPSLVRKEIVSLSVGSAVTRAGQYGFLQDLVKKVAYDTLSRKERKTLHLASAEYLRSLGDEEEVVEVLAAHYLDAYSAAPEDADAESLRETAREMLVRAGGARRLSRSE